MYAFAEGEACGEAGVVPEAKWPSFAASPLYAQKFQCGAAAGGYAAGDADFAGEDEVYAADWACGAGCAAAGVLRVLELCGRRVLRLDVEEAFGFFKEALVDGGVVISDGF